MLEQGINSFEEGQGDPIGMGRGVLSPHSAWPRTLASW